MTDDFGPATSLQRQAELYDREKRGEVIETALSPAEMETLDQKMKALKLILKDEIRATYKLEIQFGKNRTSRGVPFPGVMSAWLSGTKFHGGGDEKIFECPNPHCGAWILPHQIDQRTVVEKIDGREVEEFRSLSFCAKCARVYESKDTIGERVLQLTEQNWAYAIQKMFLRLNMDADLYLKYHPTDIRYKSAMEMARNMGGEEIAKARKNRGLHIYPLRNIITDTKHGADLYGRIRAFINA